MPEIGEGKSLSLGIFRWNADLNFPKLRESYIIYGKI